jgi:hypothetical protein
MNLGGGGAYDQDFSATSAIDIQMPNRQNFKPDVPNIESLMNGYHFIVEPADSSCSGATRVNKVGDYSETVSLSENLRHGCDYNLTLAYGNKDASASELKTVYIKNTMPHRINKGDIEGQTSITARIKIEIQPAGTQIGLKPPTGSSSSSNVTVTQPPASSGTGPTPVTPDVQLPAAKNFAVKGPKGNQISSYFRGEYLVIDLSQTDCTYCKQAAKELEQDKELQAIFTNSKCSRVTVVESISGWTNIGYGPNTFVGKNMAEYGPRPMSVAQKFGLSPNGIPYFFAIDRQGNVVSGSTGNREPTAFIDKYCK